VQSPTALFLFPPKIWLQHDFSLVITGNYTTKHGLCRVLYSLAAQTCWDWEPVEYQKSINHSSTHHTVQAPLFAVQIFSCHAEPL
jgi:hypothetical protein